METLRLASLAHLHPLGFEHLGRIAPYASELYVAAGRRLLLDGPFAHELVLIGSGRGRVRCAGETVAELGPGDAFGERAPRRTAYPRTATIVALTDLRLVLFSTRDLRELCELAPDAVAALIAVCAVAPAERAATQAGQRPAPGLALVPAAA